MSCFLFPLSTCRDLDKIISDFWWKDQEEKKKIHWVARKKLGRSKADGGLGFRDFAAFNRALLAKLGWKILNQPEQLWVRILKGLYFPKCDFLDAKKGSRASWIWNSILEGRNVLEGRLCKSIGNGLSTNIWKDPWLPSLPGMKLISSCPLEELSSMMVAELIVSDGWDFSNIDCWLLDCEKDAIFNTVRAISNREDRWVWTGGKKGVYSVKEGYRVVKNFLENDISKIPGPSSQISKDLWISIWNLKIPSKVKFFTWRLLSKAIPSFEALKKRGCSIFDMCPICGIDSETLEHLFLLCNWVKKVWFGSSLTLQISEIGMSSLEKWLETYLLNVKFDAWQKANIAMILWQIWKSRCNWVYEKKCPNPIFTFVQAESCISEYWKANGWSRRDNDNLIPGNNLPCPSWNPPNENGIKINTDAAFCSESGLAAVCFVVRDSNGWMLDGFCKKCSVSSSFMAEAIAVEEAVKYAVHNQLDEVSFESDCKSLIQCIKSGGGSPD